MPPKPDKYGSAYDPANRRPHPRNKQEQEKTMANPCGCGMASCYMCRRGLGYSAFVEAARAMAASNSIFAAYDPGMVSFQFVPDSISSISSGPPESYTSARRAVVDWIVPAPQQRFDDIVGNDEALAQLRDAIRAPVDHAALYAAYGMKMPRGALLSGPPGCGKTMFARAAASEMRSMYGGGSEFLSLSGAELQSGYVGQTEERIKAIFRFAREYKSYHGHPLLVFMDEADAILPSRDGPVTWFQKTQVATFLGEMDGMQESGAFVLLASNRPEAIDQAVLRDGRCDFKIRIERPTREALEVILLRGFSGVPLATGATAETLAFTALEALHDPARVILDAHMLGMNMETQQTAHRSRHFLLEHIVSGAMAVSLPSRAKALAFARDRATGRVSGVSTQDVCDAVARLYEENRRLDHSYALSQFRETFTSEAQEEMKAEMQRPAGREGLN